MKGTPFQDEDIVTDKQEKPVTNTVPETETVPESTSEKEGEPENEKEKETEGRRKRDNNRDDDGGPDGVSDTGNGGGILADGTGAGKTRQILAVAETISREGRPVVIIASSGIKHRGRKALFLAPTLKMEKSWASPCPIEKGILRTKKLTTPLTSKDIRGGRLW